MREIYAAIIEDEDFFVSQMIQYLETWSQEARYQISVDSYFSDEVFLQRGNTRYDIVFIDIGLPGPHDGVELAEILRDTGYTGAIVFTTSYMELMREGYKVGAMDFCTKPITYGEIADCMERVKKSVTSGSYIFKPKGSRLEISLPYDRILYCLSALHYVELVSLDGTYQQMISLKKLCQVLPAQFKQCHRTALVNMNHVSALKDNDLTMTDGTSLPISKPFLREIREAYIGLV